MFLFILVSGVLHVADQTSVRWSSDIVRAERRGGVRAPRAPAQERAERQELHHLVILDPPSASKSLLVTATSDEKTDSLIG